MLEVVSWVVGIGAGVGFFMTTVFAKDHRLKRALRWLFGVTCGIAVVAGLAVALWPSEEQSKTVNTTGPNSPAANVSGVGSGATVTVTQVSGNQTVNKGISEAMMLALLRDKSIAMNRELVEKYPYGYVLFGLSNGQLVYQTQPTDWQIKGDWPNTSLALDLQHNMATLLFKRLEIVNDKTFSAQIFEDFSMSFPLRLNEPMDAHLMFHPKLFCEVIDLEKGVFLVGLKP